MNLRVVTFNLGSGIWDYGLGKNWPHSAGCSLKDYLEQGATQYAAAQMHTAKLLWSLDAAVYLLQECASTERPEVQQLMARDYQVYPQDESKVQTAIALKNDRFTNLQMRDYECSLYVAVTATDKLSQRKLLFVSVHVPGFDYKHTDNALAEAARFGDEVLTDLIEFLQWEEEYDLLVLGGDLNADPVKWKPRFDLLKDAGFTMIAPDHPTQINPKNGDAHKLRKLDYQFLRGETAALPTGHIVDTLKLDDPKLASDHLPFLVDYDLLSLN